jgi:hypothetical protein
VRQRRFDVDIAPFEIRTFRVSRDPDIEPQETDLLERPLEAPLLPEKAVAREKAPSRPS